MAAWDNTLYYCFELTLLHGLHSLENNSIIQLLGSPIKLKVYLLVRIEPNVTYGAILGRKIDVKIVTNVFDTNFKQVPLLQIGQVTEDTALIDPFMIAKVGMMFSNCDIECTLHLHTATIEHACLNNNNFTLVC